jgi:S-(hydroxymethyl)glutathione dehydrogenase/alcohol dehydrogenase
MKALRFHMPKMVKVDTVDDPKIEDSRDAILRVTSTAICGSDLHIYNGLFPQLKPLTLGHEFMGIVEETGRDVKNLEKGDRVVVPFPIACGTCWFCSHELPTACENSNPNYGPEGKLFRQKGGGLFGYTDLYGGYAGGQAEYVRVPYADYSPRRVPESLSDEEVLFLTDIFPTGWTAIDKAELSGGETVAVFGCGPVGLMAMKSAWLQGAERVIGVDIEGYRLDMARRTAKADIIDNSEGDAPDQIRELTEGRGADVCIDAVGLEANRSIFEKLGNLVQMERGTMKVLEDCCDAVRRGGTVSVVGVYGTDYDNFPLGKIFDKGLRMWFGQSLVQNYIDGLMNLVQEKRVVLDDIITHTLPLDQAPHAYSIFNKKQDNCVKVVLKP